jgi:argonaute-like protein implicated in RNA metabolism and viral defense
MMQDKQMNHPTIVICILQRENNYQMFKEVMLQYRMPSQVITVRNGMKFNLSKATNILRQVNSKAGGDLYYLKFPEAVEKKRTMLIGIDVCHAGP